MKTILVLAMGLLLSFSTKAIAAEATVISAECTVSVDLDTSGDFETELGKFEVKKIVKSATPELVGSEYGQFQGDAYNAGHEKYAAKTTSIEVDIEREGGEPYKIKFWGMTPERKTETETELRANDLPSDLRIKVGPILLGTAQQILRSTRLSCTKK